LPFIASEEILMHAVKAGGDRQELHEVIRTLSIEAHERVKEEGLPNDFLARAEAHPVLGPVVRAMGEALAPERFTGLAAAQVEALRRRTRRSVACGRRFRCRRRRGSRLVRVPVTLRVPAVGVLAAAKALGARGVPALALEPGERGLGYSAETAVLATVGAPILAMVAPEPRDGREILGLAHGDPAARRKVAAAAESVVPLAQALRCRRVILGVGRPAFAADGGDPRTVRTTFRREREALATELLRVLHPLTRRHAGVLWHLLPTDGASSVLDAETFGWIVGELPEIRLALDSGTVAAGSRTEASLSKRGLAAHESSLGFVFLSDHDGRGAVTLPGCGVGSPAGLRGVLGGAIPRALRAPAGASFDDVVASAEECAERFQLAGDTDAWRA
jgi:hypothetical protein